MTDVVRDAIAAELAQIERVKDAPAAPLGYGSDLWCASDLSERMDEVDPMSTLALAQAIARRLGCPRGALPDDPDYGIDLRSYLNRGVTTAEIRTLATRIRNEVEKDDRIERVTVTLTPSPTGSSTRVELRVTPVDPRVGGFAMTLAATSAEVVLEAIGGRP